MAQIKRPAYEVVIVVIVIVLSVVLAGSLYAGRARIKKCELLTNELGFLRSSVTLYRITKGKYPEQLENLTTETYEMNKVTKTFLDKFPGQTKGQPIDPFGRPYLYDANSGWVRSVSPGYEKW